MPVFAALSINDGQGTPVSHTFNPTSSDNGIYTWRDQTVSSGVALGDWQITYSRKDPSGPIKTGLASNAERVYRHKLMALIPTMEALGTSDSGLTPPPTISHVHRGFVEMVQPERGSNSERKNLTAIVANALDHATFKSLLNDLAGMTGS